LNPPRELEAALAARVRLLVLDVDGVMTDGRLWFGPTGEALKVFHVRDGYGIKALQKAGVEVAVISGRASAAVAERLAELGVRHVMQGVEDKGPALARLLEQTGLAAGDCACLVDDLPDLALMHGVALPVAVADAHADVLAAAAWVTRTPGGHGAVRELCDALLAARRPT
jgi:3-deoxy-D-manno-octulosonate 8-phosphate phosphatase (KDO 8-P phosphatase)